MIIIKLIWDLKQSIVWDIRANNFSPLSYDFPKMNYTDTMKIHSCRLVKVKMPRCLWFKV